MSKVEITKITDRTGSGAPNFTNGFNIAGADSGISGFTHTEGSSEPSSPSNGDTWWDSGNDVYKVYMNNAWQDFLGTTPPGYWGGDRAIYSGGYGGVGAGAARRTEISYLNMTTTGDSADFGDLTVARNNLTSASSGTRVLILAGQTGSSAQTDANNVVDYITTATTGNATDFGNLDHVSYGGAGCGHTTRSFYIQGYQYKPGGNSRVDTIQYFTPDTTGNATDFGNVGSGAGRYGAACNSASRALIAGNDTTGPFPQNRIDYFATDTAGNSTSFGNLAAVSQEPSSTSDTTRGVWMGGYESSGNTNRIQYVTMDTTGNSTDFGNLTSAGTRYTDKATSNNVRGLLMGAGSDGLSNEYITIQTTGNATDLSDITDSNHTNGSAGSGSAS